MKLFVASDIHGSYFYLCKLMEAFEKENADQIILLGDILYHGPRNDLPEGYDCKKVSAKLNEYKDKIRCVQGNCDAEVDQMVLDFKIEPGYFIIPLEHRNLIVTHGHKVNEEHMIEHQKGDVLLHGHTHVPCLVRHEDYYYINPGSVSIPKSDSHHGYLIIEGDTYIWKDLDMNVKSTANLE